MISFLHLVVGLQHESKTGQKKKIGFFCRLQSYLSRERYSPQSQAIAFGTFSLRRGKIVLYPSKGKPQGLMAQNELSSTFHLHQGIFMI